jgi:hypothetical protein
MYRGSGGEVEDIIRSLLKEKGAEGRRKDVQRREVVDGPECGCLGGVSRRVVECTVVLVKREQRAVVKAVDTHRPRGKAGVYHVGSVEKSRVKDRG